MSKLARASGWKLLLYGDAPLPNTERKKRVVRGNIFAKPRGAGGADFEPRSTDSQTFVITELELVSGGDASIFFASSSAFACSIFAASSAF